MVVVGGVGGLFGGVSVEGGELDIAFNAAFVTDALQAITGKEFLFQLDKPLSTSIIRETEDTSFLYMITPVRTR